MEHSTAKFPQQQESGYPRPENKDSKSKIDPLKPPSTKQMKCCSALKWLKNLFIETYRPGGTLSDEKEKMTEVMRTKSRIGSTLSFILRAIFPLFGLSFWQEAF